MPFCRTDNHSDCPPSVLQILTGMIYFLCLLSFGWSYINPHSALKIFIFTAALSLILLSTNSKLLLQNKALLLLPLSVLLFGLLQVIWVAVFKHVGTHFLGSYRSYQDAGKTMVFSAFVLAALVIRPPSCLTAPRIVNSTIIILALALYGWLCYTYYGSAHGSGDRAKFDFQQGTGTAYSLTLIALLAAQALLSYRHKVATGLYFIHFALSYFAITLTQTRAAILLYPLLIISLFVINYRHNHRLLLKAGMAFLVLGLLALLPLKSVLEKRYADFRADMHAYSAENSRTSIGARFAMQKAGIIAGTTNPFIGQSLEQRSITVRAASEKDPSLRGADEYLNTHLHNEVIDTFSLKGLPGVILLLSFYAAAVYTAYRQRNPGLLVVIAAIAIYGMSDLLLYAKGGSLSSMLALCIATMLASGTPRESVYAKKT